MKQMWNSGTQQTGAYGYRECRFMYPEGLVWRYVYNFLKAREDCHPRANPKLPNQGVLQKETVSSPPAHNIFIEMWCSSFKYIDFLLLLCSPGLNSKICILAESQKICLLTGSPRICLLSETLRICLTAASL